MKSKTFASLLALACAPLALACGAPTEESTTGGSNDELVNAPLDTKNTWAVGVCASEPNTDPAAGPIGACLAAGTRCTGSLVAPNLVMTARHCVQEIDYSQATGFCDGAKFGAPLGGGRVRITLDPSVLAENPAWRDVAQVIVNPAGDNACKDDIAFLRLAAPVPAAEAKPIALDLRPLAQHHPRAVAVVGRGILTAMIDLETGAPQDADANGGLKRRYKTGIPWTCVSNNPQRPCIVDDYSSPPTNKFSLPTDAYFAFGPGTSSGDSGSAILSSSKFVAGKPVAVGVNSAGTFDKDGVGNHGLGVRLDVHRAWIMRTLHASSPGAFALDESAE